MRPLLRQTLGYALASGLALSVDTGILFLLVRLARWPTLAAATTAFLVGAIVAYVLSVRFVFDQHRLRNRRAEFLGFIALGFFIYYVARHRTQLARKHVFNRYIAQKAQPLAVVALGIRQVKLFCQLAHLSLLQMANREKRFFKRSLWHHPQKVRLVFSIVSSFI